MAFSVISWKTILLILSSGRSSRPSADKRCQAIASPSRSSSVASIISSAVLAFFFKIFKFFRAFSGTIYFGSKLFSTSTPSCDFGRSLMCPKLDSITKFLPRNLVMVLAFVGLSTIINLILDFGIIRTYLFYNTTDLKQPDNRLCLMRRHLTRPDNRVNIHRLGHDL